MIWIAIGLLISAAVSSVLIPAPRITGSLFVGALVLFIVWVFK